MFDLPAVTWVLEGFNTQYEKATIIAGNTDPALTGQVIVVEAEDKNGVPTQLTILLPPPKG